MANRDFKVRHGLNVCGNTSLGGDVAISGNLDIGGNVSLESADLSGSLQVSGSASIGGSTTLKDSLTVSGLTSLQGGLVVDTSLDVQSAMQANSISASGQLQVDGTTSLKNTLTVSGMTSLQGGLVVDGESDFQAKISANQISASGQLTVDQQVQADGSILAGQVVRAGGSLCAQAQAFVNQDLRVTQNTQLQGNLTVSGATTLCSDLSIEAAKLTISNDTAPHIQLKGSGPNSIRFHDTGSTSTTNALDLVYRATPNTLGFEKASDATKIWETDFDDLKTTFHQPVDVSGTICAGNADIGDTLQVSGNASLGSLRVAGMTSLDGGLVVRGSMSVAPTIHAGNISASGNLQVDGTTSLKSSLTVSGTTSLQGGLYVDGESDFSAKINANTISASGQLTVDQQVQADGAVLAGGTLRAGGSLCAQAQAFVNQDLRVTQNTQLQGNLTVSGATTLSSTLKVAGTTCLQGAVDINQTLAVSGAISAPGGIHAVAGNIQTTGAISGTQLKFVSAGGQRMTVSNLDSVSGRVGTLSATKFNWTSAGGQRMTISSATITSLNVSTITVNQQGNIARRISGTVDTNNSSYVTAFTVNGNNLASCIEVFFEGTISSVVVACYAEIIVNHSGDITIRTHQGNYIPLDIQVISNGDEDFAVLVKRNGGVAGTANIKFNVYPKGDETVTATATNPYSTTTFTHTGVRGTKITATGGNTHRFETDGEIIGKQTLTVSGLTSLQGGLVVDTSMDVQVAAQMNNISSSGTLTVQGTTILSGAIQAKNTLSVAGSTVLSGAVQAKNTLSVGGSQTIGGTTWANGHLRLGDANAGLAMDPNEIYFAGAGNLGTLSGNLQLNPAGSIVTGKVFDSTANIQTTAIISGTQLRCTSFAGTTADIAGTLQVSGSASLGSLRVAGDCCAQGGLGVQGGIALTGELDFNGATQKYVDFMLVSSNAATFTANFRSMDHNGQNHHTHLTLVRGGAVQLAYNNNTKAATTNTGFYVSGILSATLDVKVGRDLRAAGAISVDGAGHIAQTLQVGGQVSVGGQLIVTQSICANGHVIAGDNATGRIGLSINDGYGDANITFNHHAGIPDVAGNAARIETNVDSTTSSFITLEVGSGLQAQTAQALQTAATFYANRTEINGELQALGNTSLKGTLLVSGGASFKSGVNVSGTLSARKYNFEPYGVVPAFSNSDYGTITYNSTESAIELSSSTDTSIGMAFPAWKVNVNSGNKWEITIQIRASANTTGGVYIRVAEYDAELPDGKIAVSNSAGNALVQEDTREKGLSPQYENQNGSTTWKTLTFEYTPTSTAVWASVVVLNWTGLGTNALYVREPQIKQKLVKVPDADTLDGIDSGSFLRSDVADSSSRMKTFYTNMSSQDDFVNSPISIIERGAAGSGDGEDRDAPNLNFHWNGRVSNSLWMNSGGVLNWGSYNTSGVPATDGQFAVGTIRSDNITNRTGIQLILNAGESSGKVGGQTAELVYANAEGGFRVSCPDGSHTNWQTGYTVDFIQLTRNTMSFYQGMASDGTGAVFKQQILHDGSHARYDTIGDLRITPDGRLHMHRDGNAGGGQNRFEGLTAASSANGRSQFILSSAYSDLVIASSQANNNHGSTLTFATYNPSNAGEYNKFVVNQGNWGTRKQFLDFGYSTATNRSNPHSNINSTDTVLTLDGVNKRVGIKQINPAYNLDVTGTTRVTGAVTFSSTLAVTGTTTFNSGLIVEGSIDSGGTDYAGYRSDSTNIVLRGSSTGVSGIFFQSEKDGTNINHGSDYGYIQYHAHGIDGTSGESCKLVIGVANDSTDTVVLQSPYKDGVKISYKNTTSGTGGTEYTVWHAGNDGSGSGLDADTVDGLHSDQVKIRDARADGDITPTNFTNNVASFTFTDDIASSTRTWDSVLTMKGWTGSTYRVWQLMGNASTSGDTDTNLYFRQGLGSSWGSLEKVWTSGNDGAGSGLDADNLDGYTWTSSGKNVRATEFYADNWFRNYNSGEGLYNEANGMHWYSTANNSYSIYSLQNTVNIRFQTSGGSVRGYLYADTASSIGFLNTVGQWGLRYVSTDGRSPNLYFLESGNETWTGNPGNDEGKIEYHANRFYIASGANSNRVCQFRKSGTDVGYWSNSGEIYATSSNHRVFHDGYHPNADTLTTARTISLGGHASGSASFNGSANVTISATINKTANQMQNDTGNWHCFVNDGGGNIGQRWNSTTTGTNYLVENGIAYALVIDNESASGDYWIRRGKGVNSTAGGQITWTNAFRIVGADGGVRLYYDGSEKFITNSTGVYVEGRINFPANSTDEALIRTTVSGTTTHLDCYLSDDNNADTFRWRFNPSGGSEYNAMVLKPVSNTKSRLELSGDLLYNNNAIVASYPDANNIDHIWHDDGTNAWNFCSDTTYKNTGNSRINCGQINCGTIFMTGELNLQSSSDSSKYMDVRIGTNAFHIRKTTGGDAGHEVMARFTGDSGVDLYHNAIIRLTTTLPGVRIEGRSDNYWGGMDLRSNYASASNEAGFYLDFKNESDYPKSSIHSILLTNGESRLRFHVTAANVSRTTDTRTQVMELRTDGVHATSGWFRAYGNNGLYFQNHGGGWYMVDSTWIRSYGSKSVYHNSGAFRTDGTLQVGPSGSTLNVPNGGTATINGNRILTTADEGSGNGLDADTLDGINSGSFLRSDTSDRMDGTLTIQSGGNNTYGVLKGYPNDNHFLGIRCSVANQSGLSITAANKTSFVEYAQDNDSTGWYWLSSQNNYSEIMRLTRSAGLMVLGNRVLTTADEGSGNGLDADTLDGINSGSFLRSNANDTYTGTVLTINAGSSSNYLEVKNGSDTDIYMRFYCESQTSKIADTFSDTTTDKKYIYFSNPNGSNDPGYIMHETSNQSSGPDERNEGVLHLVPSDDNGTGDYVSIHGTNDADCIKLHTSGLIETAANYTLNFRSAGGNNVQVNGNRILTTADEGSGNGIDADTLDGVQGSSFLRSDTTDSASGQITFTNFRAEAATFANITNRVPSGFYQDGGSATTGEGWPQTTNAWYHLLSTTHSNTGNYYSMQFAGNYYNSSDIYYRSTANSGTAAWNKLWHAGNDGSGSGLDADTLDGEQLSDSATANTVVSRNGSRDITCRLLRPDFGNEATISGAIAYRINNSDNNYVRFCSDKGAIRAFLGAAPTASPNFTGQVYMSGELNLMGLSDSNKYLDVRTGGNTFYIRKTTNTAGTITQSGGDVNHEVMAHFHGDAEVALYYNNSKKFETTSSGTFTTGNFRTRSEVQIGLDGAGVYGANNIKITCRHSAADDETWMRGSDTANGTIIWQTRVNGEDNIEFTAEGNGRFDGGADIGNADYAEYFEWSDGNPNNENRRGLTVVLVEDKIRPATATDDVNDIIGVVSPAPGVVGDSHEMGWHQRYLTDEYGEKVKVSEEYLIWKENDDGTEHDVQPTRGDGDCFKRKITDNFPDDLDDEVPAWAITNNRRATMERLQPNPDYDPNLEYIPRSERQEWCTIGLMGKLVIRSGQPVNPRWKRMKIINENISKWLVI